MREIDQVRITLLRMFRGAVQLPEEIIDEMLKVFLHTQDAAIKVQAYGRGLLQRFRYHSLITKDFNMQANREWGLFLNEVQYRGEGWRTRFARHVAYEITEDFDGQSAIMGGVRARAYRRTARSLLFNPQIEFHMALIQPFGWLQRRFNSFLDARLNWRAHRSVR